jgi:hypothetical protein
MNMQDGERLRWQHMFVARTHDWCGGKRSWQTAKELAWGDIVNEFHFLHGKRWPAWQCAGCGHPIGGLESLDLPDGNRVHLQPIDCLLSFGQRWRGDAEAALLSLGLEPPDVDGGRR